MSCGFTAPADLYWQLQWDDTNTFYSGTYYNLKNRPGWSAMSGDKTWRILGAYVKPEMWISPAREQAPAQASAQRRARRTRR